MKMKFNLCKYAKVDNIEVYPVKQVTQLWEMYLEFLEQNKQKDPDFPELDLKFD